MRVSSKSRLKHARKMPSFNLLSESDTDTAENDIAHETRIMTPKALRAEKTHNQDLPNPSANLSFDMSTNSEQQVYEDPLVAESNPASSLQDTERIDGE